MLDVSPDELLDVAAAARFDAIGLRLSGEHALSDVRSFRARSDASGVGVFDAEVHRIGPAALPPEPLLDRAVAVGAEAVLVVSDDPDRAATEEALHDVVAACRERDLRCGLEYMAWTTPNTTDDAIMMARATGAEVLVDFLHHHRIGAGAGELRAIVDAGVLGWVQLCDAPRTAPVGSKPEALVDEARHRRLPPGSGALPLAELLACLPGDVTISVEVQSDVLARLGADERARRLHDATRSILDGR